MFAYRITGGRYGDTELAGLLELRPPTLLVGRVHADIPSVPADFDPDPGLSDAALPEAVSPVWKAMGSGGSTGRPKLIESGGDSRILGDRFGKPWMVGIRDPQKGEGEVITRIPLTDAAISTSGDYERFFDEDGVRYHHIIDPHTGHSASKVRSATVIGPYATRTDGLSKTAFVLGPEKAMVIYNRIDDIDAIIVKLDGTVIYSKGIQHGKATPPPPK